MQAKKKDRLFGLSFYRSDREVLDNSIWNTLTLYLKKIVICRRCQNLYLFM